MGTDSAYVDVTDATFESDVLGRSTTQPVVVDLWAPWCGPCVQLGPLLEEIVASTAGRVTLAKVNIDENPAVSQVFKVQSIPAVFAVVDRKVVSSFIGAQGRAAIVDFVSGLLPSQEENEVATLVAAGDEDSLRRALELDAGNQDAIVALGELLAADGRGDDALELLTRIPESPETRRVAALARQGVALGDDDIESKLQDLLDRVKGDDDARQQFLDLLELLGPDDPRTATYRKQLTARLF